MYGYKLVAMKDDKPVTLAEYRGDITGLKDLKIERFKLENGETCYGEANMPSDG